MYMYVIYKHAQIQYGIYCTGSENALIIQMYMYNVHCTCTEIQRQVIFFKIPERNTGYCQRSFQLIHVVPSLYLILPIL